MTTSCYGFVGEDGGGGIHYFIGCATTPEWTVNPIYGSSYYFPSDGGTNITGNSGYGVVPISGPTSLSNQAAITAWLSGHSQEGSCTACLITGYDCINGSCVPSTTYGTPGGYPSLATCQAACGAAACPTCPTCPTCEVCPTCPTCEVCPTCPDCPVTTCPICPTCEVCPTCPDCPVTTCPSCPAPTVCPSCPTCPACPPCPLFVPSESEWQSYCSGYGTLCPVFPNCPVCPDTSQSCPSCTVPPNSDGGCPTGYSRISGGEADLGCVINPPEEMNFVNISAPTFAGSCDTSGNPVYGSEQVMVIQGTEAAELLKLQALAQIQGNDYCNADAAACPDGWLIRPEYHRPQVIYQFAEINNSGVITGAPKYRITVPHHIATQPTTPLPNYQRGNWETIFVLKDNSRVTIHSLDEPNGTTMLNAIKLRIDPAYLVGSYLSKSGLVVTDDEIDQINVKNRMAKYYSTGAKNELPDWIAKW